MTHIHLANLQKGEGDTKIFKRTRKEKIKLYLNYII